MQIDPLSLALAISAPFVGLSFWTHKKYNRLARSRLKERDLVLGSLIEGILFISSDQKVEYVNFAASRLIGISKKKLEGKALPESSSLALLEKIKALLLSCKRLQSPLTDSFVMESEKKLHLDLIVMPQLDLSGHVVILQDRSSDHKVLEVGKDFVASASHELKTPITIIRGFAETLQDMKELPQEIVEDILEKIVRNCHRMDTLVKSLLTLADIESLPLTNPQYCDLESLMEECKRVVLCAHPDASIEILKHSDSITAEVEPSLLELAILNLLGNAIKYSPSPAVVVISMLQSPDEVQIKLSDEGMGIPQDDLEHIFDRFYTVNKAHSRKLGGAGLGLSLVKTIVEKHEGTIQVASTLGKGSVFTLTIPSHQH